MDDCRSLYSRRFFKVITLLLFEVSLYGVETLSCQHVIHKKVGDSVELLACLPSEGVTRAKWTYGGSRIADTAISVDVQQFTGRLKFDPTNFSLIVKNLRQQDSGEFTYVSVGSGGQRPTVKVTLKVHEPITEEPTLSGNSTWLTSTNSCRVLLECSSSSGSEVSYSWTVGTETFRGHRLQHSIRAEDGDTEFTCTVFNPVSEKSKSHTVKCSSHSTVIQTEAKSPKFLIHWITGLVVIVLMILLILIIFNRSKDSCCKKEDQSHSVNQDGPQQHIYSSLLHGDGSVYDTIREFGKAEAEGSSDDYVNDATSSAHL